jgi:hypothetical protein
MEVIYNGMTEENELNISLHDLCFTCGYKKDCPLLVELKERNVVINSAPFNKTECGLYFYLPDENVKGIYVGDPRNLGFLE